MHKFVFRVLALTAALLAPALAQSVLNQAPSRVVGQPSLTFRSSTPNVVEGREFFSPLDVTVDVSSTPRPVYVADYGNNRVLAWRDSQGFTNGAVSDFVIGQIDKTSTIPQGPGTSRTLGLSAPASVAVDSRGNLYVMDSGNNRILRFPKPIAASQDVLTPDLVIGQAGFTTNTANQGGISERSVSFSGARGDLIVDSRDNLWTTDVGNNRVLRFPKAALDAGENRPAADVVLGQPDFVSSALPTDQQSNSPLNKAILRAPNSLAADSEGRIYVGDAFGRVLVFTPDFFNGKAAARLVGIEVLQQGQTARVDEVTIFNVSSVFIANNRLGVADPSTNRITLFDPFADWPAETDTAPSPSAKVVIGQQGFTSFDPNRRQPEPSANSLAQPSGTFYTGTELFVTDTGNNRVLVFPSLTTSASATRVLGQRTFNLAAPNVAEGRELFLFNGFTSTGNLAGNFSDGGGIAIDNTSNPPHLYVADTFNNRILGYADVRKVRPGDKADVVIGQNDFEHTLVNAPSNNADSLTNSGLFRPSGLAVDASGNLYVADSGNSRVLRFAKPFEQSVSAGDRQRANLVLGQLNFNQKLTDATAQNMAYPFGLAFTVEGSLVVSDAVHSRILFFRKPVNGDFASGQAAERVIGQPDFFTVGGSTAPTRLNSPRGIALDTDDRLYVADAGNNRVVLYDRITVGSNDPTPAFTLSTGLTAPQGVWVSPFTGEIWVANTRLNNTGQATRFPRFERLAIDPRSDYTIPSAGPLALTQDASGNLYIAEAVNRVAIFYNALAFQINGNYASRPLAPGAAAVLYPAGGDKGGVSFSSSLVAFSGATVPTTVDDIQVLLNGNPVPVYAVSPFQINFLVPMNAPDSGTAEIQVIRASTGQILGVSNPQFARSAPALFTQSANGQGQVAALNEDNSVNTASNPAARGSVVQLFGTGQGFVANAPPDGTPPTGPITTAEKPRVYLGGADFVKDEDVLYSGLAPGLVGVWQINARVPQDAAPGQNDAFVLYQTISSVQLPNGTRIRTVISVK